MPQTFPNPLAIPANRGGPERAFLNADQLRVFVDEEQEFWRFLVDKGHSHTSDIARVSQYPFERLRTLGKRLSNFEKAPENFDALNAEFHTTFLRGDTRIPRSSDPDAQFVKLLANELAGEAFFMAASYLFNRTNELPLSLNNQAQMAGIIAVLNYRLGHSPSKAQAIGASLAALQKDYSTSLQQHDERMEKQHVDWEEKRQNFTENLANHVLRVEEDTEEMRKRQVFATDKLLSDKRVEFDAALARVTDLERTYNEKLHLEAPTNYWTKKRERHKKFAVGWGIVAVAWAVIATIALMFGLDSELKAIEGLTSEAPIAVYFVHAARGLVLSVIVFWIARLFVRLWLSELHLGMDAYERTTMVLTYLALSTEGKVDEKDRGLVLQALFRSTADGLVKDDASMDANVAAFFGRLGQQK